MFRLFHFFYGLVIYNKTVEIFFYIALPIDIWVNFVIFFLRISSFYSRS